MDEGGKLPGHRRRSTLVRMVRQHALAKTGRPRRRESAPATEPRRGEGTASPQRRDSGIARPRDLVAVALAAAIFGASPRVAAQEVVASSAFGAGFFAGKPATSI